MYSDITSDATMLGNVYCEMCRPLNKKTGLPHTALVILQAVSEAPDCDTAGKVSKLLLLNPSIISFNVNKLVDGGYMVRKEIPGNRRSVLLECTEKGDETAAEMSAMRDAYLNVLFQGMSEEEIETCGEHLKLMKKNMLAYLAGRKNASEG